MSDKRKIAWVSILILAIAVRLFSLYPGAVEKYYSTGTYPVTARIQRALFGWIPFSVGDVLYAAVFIWLCAGLVVVIRKIAKRQTGRAYFFDLLGKWVFAFLLVYVIFNLAWGLNYERKGIAEQLQLQVKPYSTAELTSLVSVIADRLNTLDSSARLNRSALAQKRYLFANASGSYDSLAARDARFAYPSPSVKSSLFSYALSYLGFGGYYDPFTGEAQVNTTLPLFSQPFTACHEIGHQLGYARENEANFAGYLSARSSPDPAFQYSVYFDMYLYAARELYVRDSNLVKPFREKLRPGIRKDFQELKQFNRKYSSPLEPLTMRLYGRFLKANGQPQGIMTYNEVIAWLIAYSKKYGLQSI